MSDYEYTDDCPHCDEFITIEFDDIPQEGMNKEDHPLTLSETVDRLVEAGFPSIEVVWAHDTFAVFCARA